MTTMFEYLHLVLLKSNQEILNLRNKVESLTNDLSINEKTLSLASSKFWDVSHTNHETIIEKYYA